MVWLSGSIEFPEPPASQEDFVGNLVLKREDMLLIHGAVLEKETGKRIPGAPVALHVRRKDGTEHLAGRTFSNDEGIYLLPVSRKSIAGEIAAIVVKSEMKQQ